MAKLISPEVDRYVCAELIFPERPSAQIVSSLFSATFIRLRVYVLGDCGELTVFNPLFPHIYNQLRVKTAEGV